MPSFTIPNAADAEHADQAKVDSVDLDILLGGFTRDGVISGCGVTAQGSPDMTVAVAAGTVYINGESVAVASGNVTITTANGSNPRFDLIVVNSAGAKSAVAGTAAATPEFPAIPANSVVLAAVRVPASDTTISTGQITDKRVILQLSSAGSYDVTDYGAVADDYYSDGVAVATNTTFTSATAAFTSADAGKTIVIEKAKSEFRAHTTTIASVTNATDVVLTVAPDRSQSSARFLLSRGGDSTAAIQAAIDAATAAGGGEVRLPGPGYLTTGLVIKNRVTIRGSGRRSTCLHLAASSNVPVIKNDVTANDTAEFFLIRDLMIDGNATNQSNTSVNLGAAYTVGDATITLQTGQGTSMLPAGTILIGTNRLQYTSVSGDVLSGIVGGIEDTTDANGANGAAVTHYRAHGLWMRGPQGTTPANAENFDPHNVISDVIIRECKADGVVMWGQSENRVQRVFVMDAFEVGFRTVFDSWLSECSAASCGRMGFFSRFSSIRYVGCKAFNNGSVTASKGFGFLLEHIVTPAEGGTLLAACEAQDNRADGFYIRFSDRVTMSACHASSNGKSGTDRTGLGAGDGTYVGLKMASANWCVIDLTSTETAHNAGVTCQVNALYIDAGSNYNQVRLTHGEGNPAVLPADMTRVIRSDSDLSGGNNIVINSMGGTRTRTPATGTFTVTIASPAVFTKTAHGLKRGDAIRLTTSGALPTGLAINTTYWVISAGLAADTFRVSASLDGAAVNTSGTQSGTHSIQGMISPDPYVATLHRSTAIPHNIRVENPQNAHLNAPLEFIFVQDGTGGRTVTFGTAYSLGSFVVNPVPSSISAVRFIYDGSSWIATSYKNEVIGRGGSVLSPTGAVNVYVWRAPYACSVTNVRGIRRGGTGATINARRNGSSNHLASALSVTSVDTWMDGGTVQNTAYAAGDILEIMVVTVAGSPTEVGIQVDFAA